MLLANIKVGEIFVQTDEHGEPINPRGRVGDTSDLQQSIKQLQVLVEPLLVRQRTSGGYWLVHGHRRFTAVSVLGWDTVPCNITDQTSTPDEDIMLMLAGDTNKKYPALHLSRTFQRLLGAGHSMKDIADAWGQTPDQVSAHIQLLAASPDVRDAVIDGRMGTSVFSRIKHLSPNEQKEIVNGVDGRISMRYVMQKMRQRHDDVPTTTTSAKQIDRSIKGAYHRIFSALEEIVTAMSNGRLPSQYDEWPPDIRILHEEITSKLSQIRPRPFPHSNGTEPVKKKPPAALRLD